MMQQQLFEGRELQAVDYELKTPALKRTAGELARLCKVDGIDFMHSEIGREFDVVITYREAHVDHGADIDEEGNEKNEFSRTVELQAIKSSARIIAVRTREDVERAWDQAHGATG